MVKQTFIALLFIGSCSSLYTSHTKGATLYFLDIKEQRICEDLFDASTCQSVDPNGRYLVLTEENFFIISEKLEDCRIKSE